MGMDQDEIIWRAFLQWDPDLLSDNPKQNKSFFGCLFALNQFRHIYENNYLAGYELVSYANAPACELSFSVALPNGFYYRGFVDAVLQHTITGKVVVLEVKTTSDTAVNPAKFKNSAQAIGYSIVLDAIFPDLSGYEVLYLAYQTKSESYVQIPFEKSFYQRALWIRELLLDVDTIMLYEAAQIYPMHGESCRSFNRDCEYLTTCTLSTQALTESLSPADTQKLLEQRESFQIKITLADLIQSQLSKEANHDSRFNGSGTSQSGSSISATTTEDILL